MSQFHKPRETDYYLRIPTELVFVQVSIALSLHVLCSLSRWRCCPSEIIRLLSERSAKCLHASIFSPSCPYTACVCVCECVFSPHNNCKSSSSVYRVCTAKPITTYECTL